MDLSEIAISADGLHDVRLMISRQVIVQELSNIVRNACEAMAGMDGSVRNGRVELSSQIEGGHVVVLVSDNGPGLDENELQALRAFLPGRKNLSKRRSTGYGLLNAKKSVEAHDGTLEVDSILGRGTTVTIRMPLQEAT